MHEKVFEISNSFDYSKSTYNLNFRSLLLQNYFEVFITNPTYYDLLITYSESFEKAIRREAKMDVKRQEGYLNFIKLTRQTAHLVNANKSNHSIRKKISATFPLRNKDWLINIVNQLTKKGRSI